MMVLIPNREMSEQQDVVYRVYNHDLIVQIRLM